MNTNVTEVIFNSTAVELKARPDSQTVSGWSVIAFTPDVSIRCTRIHNQKSLARFIESILGACDADGEDHEYELLESKIAAITQ